MEKGSVLVITLIGVAILSIMMMGLLTVGTTEVHTTQNYNMDKDSYYEAIKGVEVARSDIMNAFTADDVAALIYTKDANVVEMPNGSTKTFISGSILDLQEDTPQSIKVFTGFDSPALTGITLGSDINTVIWHVPISAEIKSGTKKAYKEIHVGVYYILKIKY